MRQQPEPSGNLTELSTPTYIFYVTLCQFLFGYCIRAEAPSEMVLTRYLNKFYPKIWSCIKAEKPDTEQLIGRTLYVEDEELWKNRG